MTSTSPRSKTSLKVQINALRRRLRRLSEEDRRVAIKKLVDGSVDSSASHRAPGGLGASRRR